jgi:hypothetical protein
LERARRGHCFCLIALILFFKASSMICNFV